MIRSTITGDIESLDVQDKQVKFKPHIAAMYNDKLLFDTFTYERNGTVEAVIGAQPCWKGRFSIWAIIGDVSSWPRFTKEVDRLINDYASEHGIIRMELATELGFKESERWAEILNFKFESEMKNYGIDGNTFKMWVKLWQR